MRKKLFICSLAIIFCVVTVMITADARAEYPDKPIEFVVHSSPGGGSDLFARTVAHILEKEGLVKVKINVKNRRGGSGTKALDFLHSKEGDPYVLMQVTTSPLSAILRGSSKRNGRQIIADSHPSAYPWWAHFLLDDLFIKVDTVTTVYSRGKFI